MTRSLLASCLFLAFSGCFPDDELDYDELHVSALRSDGTLASTVPQNGCVTLPILLGSRIEATVTIASQIDVQVSATRDRAEVRITGPAGSEHLSVPAEDLRWKTELGQIAIEGSGGQIFTVRLRSVCPKSDAATE
jgi:hypothetical protein